MDSNDRRTNKEDMVKSKENKPQIKHMITITLEWDKRRLVAGTVIYDVYKFLRRMGSYKHRTKWVDDVPIKEVCGKGWTIGEMLQKIYGLESRPKRCALYKKFYYELKRELKIAVRTLYHAGILDRSSHAYYISTEPMKIEECYSEVSEHDEKI